MSCKVVRNLHPSFALKKSAPYSASAAEDITAVMMALLMWTGALKGGGGSDGCGA